MAGQDGDGSNDREIFGILRTHGTDIATLKTAVGSIQNEQHNISAMLNKMNETLNEQKAARGPGLMQVLGGAALCCGVFGAAAAAITVLVGSQFAPSISEIKTNLGAVSAVVQRIDIEKTHRDADELKALGTDKGRRMTDTDRILSDRLKVLEDRLSQSAVPSR